MDFIHHKRSLPRMRFFWKKEENVEVSVVYEVLKTLSLKHQEEFEFC